MDGSASITRVGTSTDPTLPTSSSPTHRVGRRAKRAYVELSPLVFRCSWLGILALHGLCMGYFTLVAWVYWSLPVSYPELGIDSYSLFMESTYFRLLSNVHWVVVGAHGTLASLMVTSSLVQRRLVFFPFQGVDLTEKLGQSLKSSTREGQASFVSILLRLHTTINKHFGRFSLFGVESPYSNVMMIVREAMETALQSYQAYRMSLYVPRVWLNRLFVALLVLNCWVTPLVLVFFKRRPMTCRLLYLLCDCVLDLMSSIAIPLILLPAYVKEFDPKVGGFDLSLSYDDVWYVSAVSELQLVFISSWIDLFSRIVFYAGAISCMKSIKDLLRPKVSQTGKRIGPTTATPMHNSTIQVLPSFPMSSDCAITPKTQQMTPLTRSDSPMARRFKHIIHLGFVVWSLTIMTLHLQAEQQEDLTQCLMQVRPWMTSRPACLLLIMDCHHYEVPGSVEDIAPYWDHADEATVTRIVIRHCPQLQMPSKITSYPYLSAIKIYNSTVVQWDDDAALTSRHHPTLNIVLVLRSNFTDGQLPVGLLSADFPPILYDIEFQFSNLRTLPDDLDKKWHSGSYLVFENCQFDHFPLVLQRVVPGVISLAFNRITTVPFEVFQVNGTTHLNLAGNPISTLSKPAHKANVDIGSLGSLNLIRTNVSYLPRWIDLLLSRATPTLSVLLCDSPFCVHRNEIAVGSRSHFPEIDTMPLDKLSDVMSVTASELPRLDKKVSCTMTEIYYYPFERDDARNGLHDTA